MSSNLFLIYFGIFIGCLKSTHHTIHTKASDEKFPPKGWKIIGSCAADFNKDNFLDKAYVIQEEKETSIGADDECIAGDPYYRKELIIKFGLSTGGYTINHKSTAIFGTCNWGIQGSDPFDEISTRKNTLKLAFSTGGTLRSHLSYYFRFQENDWFLIGYEEETYQVPYLDQYIMEINYLTGKQINYEIIKGKRSKSEITTLQRTKLSTLDGINALKHKEDGE